MITIEKDTSQFDLLWEIYLEAFPLYEQRSKEDICTLIENDRFIFASLKRDGNIIGLAGYRIIDDIVYLEYLAIIPELRGAGAGSEFLKVFIQMFEDKTIVLEVEVPHTEIQHRRISFYERNGFFLNKHIFKQPPLQERFETVDLQLMTFPGTCSNSDWETIANTLLSRVYL